MTAPLSILDDRMKSALRERFLHRVFVGSGVPFVFGWCDWCRLDHAAISPTPQRPGDDDTP